MIKMEVLPYKDGKYTLEDDSPDNIRKVIGGPIELINIHNGKAMIVNEEGSLMQLGINYQASDIAKITIVGNVILTSLTELQEWDKKHTDLGFGEKKILSKPKNGVGIIIFDCGCKCSHIFIKNAYEPKPCDNHTKEQLVVEAMGK